MTSDQTAPATTEDGKELLPIPQPPTHLYGYLGNLPDLDPNFQAQSIWRLTDLYGPIFKLDFVSRRAVVLSSYAMIKDALDDSKYEKKITGVLRELRPVIKDGLFTAEPQELNWHKAHRILMPVFGPIGVKKMFAEQLDMASQLVLKWDRLGPDHLIEAADDFTRLAFDTIGLCAFNYRFNNFYAEHMHAFATQMADSLKEAGRRASRTSLETTLRVWSQQKLASDVGAMHRLCDELVAERKAHPRPELNDLLNTMLYAKDPVTGEGLDDENIRFQMCTFLIAGHETTSGTLSYFFYHLLKNPEALHKAQQEVDRVVGDNAIEFKHLGQLKYVAAALKETLRLSPVIALGSRHAKDDRVIGGKYWISKDDNLIFNYKALHLDPAVWGDDAAAFRPERMYDGFNTDAWRPFGTGMRACIGRTFAEQEMVINVALILQRFQVELADPSYELKIKSTLTTKPDNFFIKVRRRPGKDTMVGLGGPRASTAAASGHDQVQAQAHEATSQRGRGKLTVLFGSNAGTCKAFAQELQTDAPEHGFDAEVLSLDQATEHLPKGRPVVIVVSSYEGLPPDNAKKFVAWLEANKTSGGGGGAVAKDVQYTVFGVGNGEWTQTYHRVPKLIDALLQEGGATRVSQPAYADVRADCTGAWEAFAEQLWTTLEATGHGGGSAEAKSELQAVVTRHDMPSLLGGQDMSYGIVRSARSLGGQHVGPEKREIEIALPAGVSYATGDYLVVQPLNHRETVGRALRRFGLHADDLIAVSGTRKSFLQPSAGRSGIEAAVFFSQRVELGQAATARQLEGLLRYAESEPDRATLQELVDHHQARVLDRSYSLLDVLEDLPGVRAPLGVFIDALKPLTPRQYSISSSPLHAANHTPAKLDEDKDQHLDVAAAESYTASLTYDVHETAARSSTPGHARTFHGVCSSYLASLAAGSRVHCFVRRTNASFHLPADPKTPIIMVAAGTGLAPMRGFVQERAAVAEAQGPQALGTALLYFGCRDAEHDYIYRDELAAWEKAGVVSVRPAFSRQGPAGQGDAARFSYTHERLWAEREELRRLFRDEGAKVFLCGSASKLAKSTAEVLVRIKRDGTGESEAEALEWLNGIRQTRYVSDVYD